MTTEVRVVCAHGVEYPSKMSLSELNAREDGRRDCLPYRRQIRQVEVTEWQDVEET